MSANTRNNLTIERRLAFKQLMETLAQPPAERRRSKRQPKYQQRLYDTRSHAVTRRSPVANRLYAVDVDNQDDSSEGGDDQALFNYQFQIAITIDVISQQSRRQQRAEVGDRVQVQTKLSASAKTESERRQNHHPNSHKRCSQGTHDPLFANIPALPGNQQFGESDDPEHIGNPHRHWQNEEIDAAEHRRIRAIPDLENCKDEKNRGRIRKVDANLFASFQRPVRGGGPKIDVNVEQKRIGEG